MTVNAFAARQAGSKLESISYSLGNLNADEVEVDVEYCGICYSDLHMLNNDWGITKYPFVPGHEIIGKISRIGTDVTHLTIGQYVGIGWRARSCLICDQCLSGHHNRCLKGEDVIVGRHGGFADKVRCQKIWAFPLPQGIDIKTAGPLFCGGITVFSPVIQKGIKPTDHVAVVGIGGLGHLALQFLNAWGCDVTAFSTNSDKEKEARKLGASQFLSSRDPSNLKTARNSFDMVLVTTNTDLDWDTYISTLRPGGQLHIVGATPPATVNVASLIAGDKTIGGSPIGSPATIIKMLEFCSRHGISPVTEEFPLSKVNEALAHLKEGRARYRIVLKNDW